jgi:hypothetical protein
MSLSGLNNAVLDFGRHLEWAAREAKEAPQYKYFLRPVYKCCVGKVGSVFATGITVLSANIVLHQPLANALVCLSSYAFGEGTCDISWYSSWFVADMCMAMSVMYVKYKRGHHPETAPTFRPFIPIPSSAYTFTAVPISQTTK